MSTERTEPAASYWELLRHRDFALLWSGQTVSTLGDRVFPVALAVAVLQSGAGAGGLGVVLAALALGLTVVVLPAGLIADRIPRNHAMIIADALRMVAVVGLTILGGHAIEVVAVLAFVIGLGEGLFTPAFNSIMPQVLPNRPIQRGNALVSLSARVCLLLGPALAALLVSLGGVRLALGFDAATYAVSLITLVALRFRRAEQADGVRPSLSIVEIAGGLREIVRRPWAASVMLMSSVHMLIVSAAWTLLLPVVSRSRLGGTNSYSELLILFGVGALVGAAVATRWQPLRPGVAGLLALYPFGGMLLATALSRSVIVIGAVTVLAGIGLELFGIIWMTALQRAIPEQSLARVMSLDFFVSGLLYPAGLALMGPVATHIGTTPVLVFAAAVLAVTAPLPLLASGGVMFASRSDGPAASDVWQPVASEPA